MDTLFHESVSHLDAIDSFFKVSLDGANYVAPHWHRSLEIIYLLDGFLEVTVNSTVYDLTKGDFILISPNHIHSCNCPESNQAILLQISYNFLKKYIPDIDYILFANLPTSMNPSLDPYSATITFLLHEMMTVYSSNVPYSHLLFNKLQFELVHEIMLHYSKSINHLVSTKTTKEFERLGAILTYLQANYQSPLTLQDISSYAALTPAYFCRYFKRHMGITVMEYLNSLRLEHIYHDLIYTDYPLSYLLEKHGFYNYKVFRKMFYLTFGMTPGQLKKTL